jgi:hypothetical protein
MFETRGASAFPWSVSERPRPVIRGPVPQSSEADTDPVSGRPKERCEIGVGAESVGNFNSRSVAWKRGSMRSGSMSGSVF